MVSTTTRHLSNLRGNRGPQGPAGSFAGATAESLPSGDEATVRLSGPENARVAQFGIPRGLPGVNAVPTDEALAAYLGAPDTDAGAAVRALINRAVGAARGTLTPRLQIVGKAPVLAFADQPARSLYFPEVIEYPDGTVTLRYSTDHEFTHGNSGIYDAEADSLDDLLAGNFRNIKLAYRDDTAGEQTETPSTIFDGDREVLFYQQAGVGVNQSTLCATRPLGSKGPFTRVGVTMDRVVGTNSGQGHTGYARLFHDLSGAPRAVTLYGGGPNGASAMWTPKPDVTLHWDLETPLLGKQVDMLDDFVQYAHPKSSPSSSSANADVELRSLAVKIFHGGYFPWNGRVWWMGLIGPGASGLYTAVNGIGAAPMRDDLHGFAEPAVNLTPELAGWEGATGIDGFGDIRLVGGRLIGVYRSGAQGGFGLVEVM